MVTALIGASSDIKRINDLINYVADTGLNILISGETGVGKEVVAQNLFLRSPRVNKPFVKINCAALPEGLLESELFGYERGAFTGAAHKKRGKIELADGGILFLDEIGDMPILLQSKMLHVLQSGEFSPLGAEKEKKSDTWIIAATNRDLKKEVKAKRFREDLYYRLNTINIHIPPLRKRAEDIPPLIDYYLNQYLSQYKNKPLSKPDENIIGKLVQYHWPGNVRQLQNVLKRTLILGNWNEMLKGLAQHDDQLEESDVSAQTEHTSSILGEFPDFDNEQDIKSFSLKKIRKQAIDRVEKEVIAHTLEKTGWNRSKAAKILKISYKTLLSKISSLNMNPPNNFLS